MSPGTEFANDFCAGIGPLQLGVVLALLLTIMQSLSDLDMIVNNVVPNPLWVYDDRMQSMQ